MKDNHRYDDIINLPHPESKKHQRMSVMNRAAQFAPFAALTGYEDKIDEAGRLTEKQIILEENNREELDYKLNWAMRNKDKPIVVEYFVPDEKKEGGMYLQTSGIIKKIDTENRCIVFDNGKRIHFEHIIDIKEGMEPV